MATRDWTSSCTRRLSHGWIEFAKDGIKLLRWAAPEDHVGSDLSLCHVGEQSVSSSISRRDTHVTCFANEIFFSISCDVRKDRHLQSSSYSFGASCSTSSAATETYPARTQDESRLRRGDIQETKKSRQRSLGGPVSLTSRPKLSRGVFNQTTPTTQHRSIGPEWFQRLIASVATTRRV